MNTVRVFLLIAGLTAVFAVVGQLVGGTRGMLIALAIAIALNFATYYSSGKLVLRAYGARVVDQAEAPDLYALVSRLAERAGLPMPTLAIAPQPQPNAFATGRNARHAVVCVTEGALPFLDREELEAVLAHELGHVKNHDMLLMTIAATLAGAVGYLANFGLWFGGRDRQNPIAMLLMMILAPFAAMMIHLAVSRQREYQADATGARITGKPLKLASALRRLDAGAHEVPMRIPPAVAPLAQVDPLAATSSGMTRLFSTHPPTEMRIARLEELARESSAAA